MGFIRDILERKRAREGKFKELQEDDRNFNTLNERKQSHAERELIKQLEKERQATIKEALKWDSKRQEAEDKMNATNSMKFNPELWNDDSILRQKNVFLRGGFGWQ